LLLVDIDVISFLAWETIQSESHHWLQVI